MRAPLTGFFLHALAATERDPEIQSKPLVVPAKAGTQRLRSAPGTLCNAAKGGRTRPRIARAARGIAPLLPQAMDALSANSGRPQRTRRFAPGAAPRVCSLWLLSLAQARESAPTARMAGEKTQRRESVVAQSQRTKTRAVG